MPAFHTRRSVLIGGSACAAYLGPLAFPPLPDIPASDVFPRGAEVLRARLTPILAVARERNENAVAETIERIDGVFSSYKDKLGPFVDEVYSFSRLAKLAGLSVTDWLTGQNSAGESVERLFRRHVFTEPKFKSDLAAILDAFQTKLRAENSALLLADLEGAASASEAALTRSVSRERFAELILTQAADAARPETSSITVEVLSTGAAVTLAAMIGARVAASLAARAASAGGGAVIGSWAPVVGTLVGAVVGFIADALVQHWVQEKAKDQMVAELSAKLDEVRDQMIEGEPYGTGLRHDLEAAAHAFNLAQHTAAQALVAGA